MLSLCNTRKARNKAMTVAQCLTLLLLACMLLLPIRSSRADSRPAEATSPSSVTQAETDSLHVLAAAFYSLQDDFKTTLTLNNKAPRMLEVQPTLFSSAGERLDVTSVFVEPTSFRIIDLGELVEGAPPDFQYGSLQLTYYGMELMMGAQVKLLDAAHHISFDEQLVEPAAMFSSSRLEGVWWLPNRHCDLKMILSNTTDEPILVNTVGTGAAAGQNVPTSFALIPHETRVVDLRSALAGKRDGLLPDVGGISITHAGRPGALLARGMIKDSMTGYSAGVAFSDPLNSKSSQLHGAGLRLGSIGSERLSPVIVARNLSETPTVVSGQILYSRSSNPSDTVKLPPMKLRPGEVRRARVPALDVEAATGLQFEYSTAPGTVAMSALSVSKSGDHIFAVPLLDPAAQHSSTGGYPWFIEGDSSTLVYIKNVTDREQEFVLELRFAGGSYTLGLNRLAAGQTSVVDARRLRDTQLPDENGVVIPKQAIAGQVHWSVRGPEELVLIGRAEQVDTARGVSSSYACQNCCGDSFGEGRCLPGTVIGTPGQTVQFTAQERDHDCFGNPLTWFTVSTSSWGSDDTTVATVTSSGLGTAHNPGNTTIRATWSAYVRHFTGYPVHCVVETITGPFAAAACAVRPRIDVAKPTFNPVSVSVGGGNHTTTGSVVISASPACDIDDSCLKMGDFVIVEIIKNTAGGNFSYLVGNVPTQTQPVTLMLGDTVTASFSVTANSGTPIKNYTFTIRVSDVRRPDGASGSTSILQNVVLNPANGGSSEVLFVNP